MATNDGSAIHDEEIHLRAAVQSAVLQIIQEQESSGGNNDNNNNNNMDFFGTKPTIRVKNSAVLTLSEILYVYATKCLGPDLVAFAQHQQHSKSTSVRKNNVPATTASANRVRIAVSDVLLAARKNPAGLRDKLQDYVNQRQVEQERQTVINVSSKASRRRSKMAAAKAVMDASSSSSEDEELKLAMAEVRQKKKRSSLHNDDFLLDSPQVGSPGETSVQSDSASKSQKKRHSARKKKSKSSPKPKRYAAHNADSSSSSDNDDETKSTNLAPSKRSLGVSRLSNEGSVQKRRRSKENASTRQFAAKRKPAPIAAHASSSSEDDDDNPKFFPTQSQKRNPALLRDMLESDDDF